MKGFCFVVPGQPVAKGRPRAVRRGRTLAMITPQRTRAYEAIVAEAVRAAYAGPQLAGPLAVDVLALFRRPRRLLRRKDPAGLVPHVARPDCDNVIKAVYDGIGRAGAWRDDSQVCAGQVAKFYHAKGGRPGVVVAVSPLGGVDSYSPWLFRMLEAARVSGVRLDVPLGGASD